jgi:type V secretory pathway adhesin AidA
MSDFINRRLSTDELGARGALQAAIDYDDDAPDPNSINHRFKGTNNQIDTGRAALYPFPKAAEGSYFTAAPGYVVQSDILKPLGNSLMVRDDTFKIRAYGETVDLSGEVVAQAYCEAIVQRTTEYIDPSDDPTTPTIDIDIQGNVTGTPSVSDINERFGRRLKIVSLRWLEPSQI